MWIVLPTDDNYSKHYIVLVPKDVGEEKILQQATELHNFLFSECPSMFYKQLKSLFAGEKQKDKATLELFKAFYNHYPRKVGKHKAYQSFKRQCTSSKKFNIIMDGLAKYLVKWKKDGTEKQFIPHPATWLNQKRWEDEEIQKTTLEQAHNDMERIFDRNK